MQLALPFFREKDICCFVCANHSVEENSCLGSIESGECLFKKKQGSTRRGKHGCFYNYFELKVY